MNPTFDRALLGTTVLERDGRLAVGLCGQLLRGLGANVVRCERGDPVFPELTPEAAARAVHTVRDGKTWEQAGEGWTRWLEIADVVLIGAEDHSEPASIIASSHARVICAISPFGLDAPQGYSVSEIELQAQAGLMAVTGAAGGLPETIGVPVAETMAALNATTAIVAALRLKHERKVLDIALFDSVLTFFGPFVGTVRAGKHTGYRLGAAHHLCSPWNAYATRDGRVQLCSANDDEWRKVLDVIGLSHLRDDARYDSAAARVARSAEVDGYISAWTRTRDSDAAFSAFAAAGVPVGRIRRVPDVLAERSKPPRAVCGADLFLTKVGTGEDEESQRDSVRTAAQSPLTCASYGPLSGVRVIEIGSYTAGPLAGRYLADLGAEVIKIEPAAGEVSRRWAPQVGPWSAFFVNCNIGKKFLSLDLRSVTDRSAFLELAASSDVVLTSLKPGALDRLGVGPSQLRAIFPSLIFCSISGFGLQGDARPALDTVVQAEAGLMRLVGDGQESLRIGVSIADQGAAHSAPLAILAALAERDRSGRGALIDVSMFNVMLWLTLLTWPSGQPAVRQWAKVETRDGCVIVDADKVAVSALIGAEAAQSTRHDIVARLAKNGLRAVAVLELDEVFSHPIVTRRGLMTLVGPEDAAIAVVQAPFRLGPQPPVYGRVCARPDADRTELVGRKV
jgi:crotonobetainyl-CoA:carnitine CoA-transferase CaiB-like acyl-CoA transferase